MSAGSQNNGGAGKGLRPEGGPHTQPKYRLFPYRHINTSHSTGSSKRCDEDPRGPLKDNTGSMGTDGATNRATSKGKPLRDSGIWSVQNPAPSIQQHSMAPNSNNQPSSKPNNMKTHFPSTLPAPSIQSPSKPPAPYKQSPSSTPNFSRPLRSKGEDSNEGKVQNSRPNMNSSDPGTAVSKPSKDHTQSSKAAYLPTVFEESEENDRPRW